METVVVRKYAKLSEAMVARFISYLTDIFFMVLRADFFFIHCDPQEKFRKNSAKTGIARCIPHATPVLFGVCITSMISNF